jgi:hypothetical protein
MCGFPFSTRNAQYLFRQFRTLYYAHQCSGACRSVDTVALHHKYDDTWGTIRCRAVSWLGGSEGSDVVVAIDVP